MFVRSLLLGMIAVVGFAGTAEAAKVTKFIVTCVDRTDATDDDVFLAGMRDGKAIPWGDGFQAGTSVGNTANLSEKDANEMSFALDAKSLGELVFTDTLEVSVKEKDLTVEQLIGILKISPKDGHKVVTLKGGAGDDAFEYRVEYEVAP